MLKEGVNIKITKVKARQIIDSRGNPTIEVDVHTNVSFGRASVPSGASKGKYEALELRDNNKKYLGKGVLKAVDNVNRIIAKKIQGIDCRAQEKIDNLMIKLDGTSNKSKLGANAILAVSLAIARAASGNCLYRYLSKLTGNSKFLMPIPFSNVINGGRHAGNALKIQEFMIAPVGARTFSDAIRMNSETYHTLKNIINKKYGKTATNVGDEGGFSPNIDDARTALNLLEKAIEEAGYNKKIKIAIDFAASEYYNKGIYSLNRQYSSEILTNYYMELLKCYPIISFEDPFSQDDFDAFQKITSKTKIQIVGDDLLATNKERIKTAIKNKLCNALLLKLNQIGTLTEAIEAAKLATKAGWNIMVSHRSGETEDTFISDLAVALGSGQIKAGAPCRGERTAKYNQLLRIEEELGKARYANIFK